MFWLIIWMICWTWPYTLNMALHYRKQALCRVPALKTLGKEGSAYSASTKLSLSSTFSRALGKEVCRVPESPRQRKAAVTAPGDRDSVFAECPGWHSAKELPLPSVCPTALDKEPVREGPHVSSLPSARYGTRQSVPLCRVSETLHSAKNLYRCPGLGSLPSAMVLTLGKAPLCRVSHSAKWPVDTFLICFPYSIQTNKRYHIYITYITYIHHRYHHKHK
jgi:hypothetical protein